MRGLKRRRGEEKARGKFERSECKNSDGGIRRNTHTHTNYKEFYSLRPFPDMQQ